MEPDAQFLEGIIKGIISFPDEAKVERIVDERGVLLTIHVKQDDMGKVIGKAGETAHALRLFMRNFGAMRNSVISVKIFEPEGSRFKTAYNNPLDTKGF